MQAPPVDGLERIRLPNHRAASDPVAALDGDRYPLALVEWHDAWFDHDALTKEDRRTDYLVRTVGFLIEDGPRVISVAHELLPDGEGFRAVTHIPVAVVERIVPIGSAG